MDPISAAIPFAPRVLTALLVLGPIPKERRAELFSLIESAIEAKSGLDVQPAEQWVDPAELTRCPIEERFSCWSNVLARNASAPRALLVAFASGPATATRISGALFDLEAAKAIVASEPSPAQREERLFRLVAEAPADTVASQGLSRSIETWVTGPFDSTLAALDARKARGSLEIQSRGGVLSIDGQVLGTVGTSVRIEWIPPGAHRVSITGTETVSTEIVVFEGASRVVSLEPSEVVGDWMTPATVVLGSVAATVGVGMAVYALAKDPTSTFCLSSKVSECPSSRALTFSEPARGTIGEGGSLDGLAVYVPATTLLVAGVTWVVSSYWESDDPVLNLLLGLGAGALTFGVAAATAP